MWDIFWHYDNDRSFCNWSCLRNISRIIYLQGIKFKAPCWHYYWNWDHNWCHSANDFSVSLLSCLFILENLLKRVLWLLRAVSDNKWVINGMFIDRSLYWCWVYYTSGRPSSLSWFKALICSNKWDDEIDTMIYRSLFGTSHYRCSIFT